MECNKFINDICPGATYVFTNLLVGKLSDPKRTEAISFLKDLLLKDKFSPDVVTWFCENIDLIDDQSMMLIEYLQYVGNVNADEIINDSLIINCLLISFVVAIGS